LVPLAQKIEMSSLVRLEIQIEIIRHALTPIHSIVSASLISESSQSWFGPNWRLFF